MLNERYKVLVPLGVSSMARTYLVEDTQIPGQQCVLKKLISSSHDSAYLEIARRLFRREAQALQQLGQHEGIPKLLDYFEHENEFYLVYEWIDGEPLEPREIAKGKQWSEAELVPFLQEMLGILEVVHTHRIIHRDIKPSNILRRRADARLVLMDFGNVKEVQVAAVALPSASGTPQLPMVGTPDYMPEEQQQGEPCPASDIYALGVVAIQAISGLSPHHLGRDQSGELVWRRYVDRISDELAAILTQMVRRDYWQRYQSATDVLQDLRGVVNHTLIQDAVPGTQLATPTQPAKSKKRKRLWSKALLGLLVLGGVAGLGYWGWTWYSRNTVQKAEREMLAKLEALYQAGNYPQCREVARVAIATQPTRYTSADYQPQLKEKQAKCTLGEANTLADKNQLRDAMLILADVDPKTELYGVAQGKIKNFGKEICTWAINSAETANDREQFLGFLRNGRSVPDFYPEKQKCQAEINQLEQAWDENIKPLESAQTALKKGQCQQAETTLNTFATSRFKYWQNVRAEQTENVKKCRTPLAVKGRLTDSSPTRTFSQGGVSSELPFEQHEFPGFKGQKIVIQMSATNFEPYLYLYDPTGSFLKQNDEKKPNQPKPTTQKPTAKPPDNQNKPKPKPDPAKPKQSKIELEIPKDGQYKLFVTKFYASAKGVGPYNLSVQVK